MLQPSHYHLACDHITLKEFFQSGRVFVRLIIKTDWITGFSTSTTVLQVCPGRNYLKLQGFARIEGLNFSHQEGNMCFPELGAHQPITNTAIIMLCISIKDLLKWPYITDNTCMCVYVCKYSYTSVYKNVTKEALSHK